MHSEMSCEKSLILLLNMLLLSLMTKRRLLKSEQGK
nr:MAG TPA: hypothetical protein [Caudoviricetes sp.]